jgi:hypothetical protein
LGLGILSWATAGLYLSDIAEQKLGFEASEEDKERLQAMIPKVSVVKES